MKIPKKIYISPETEPRLKEKAESINITGRGWLGNFLDTLSLKQIVFLDENAQTLLKALNLKPNSS